jgi:hypothetical protein
MASPGFKIQLIYTDFHNMSTNALAAKLIQILTYKYIVPSNILHVKCFNQI